MRNRIEQKPLQLADYYSPPVRITMYGTFLELVEQDGFRADIDDGSEGPIPLSDAYGAMTYQEAAGVKFSADRMTGLHRLSVGQHPTADEQCVWPVVIDVQHRTVSFGVFRQRE
jgi:hypothetical protein